MKQTTDLVSETFEEGGLLSKVISNYKPRSQQLELSKKIQESMKNQIPLIAEAPTGTGKSLAALAPAFEHIMKTDEPVIAVTSSIILQEQYMNKDIPMLEKLYDFSASPVLIKGRNNYLCPRKYNEFRNGKVGFNTSEQIKEAGDVNRWATQTKTGDKAELDFNPTYGVWSKFACIDNNECTGKQCSLFSNCHYYRERNKIPSSKLIVTNYHYFFSALESMAPMLPPKARVVIMDEGHEISSIIEDSF
jgi:ATP-dependent DNA helicase DinG